MAEFRRVNLRLNLDSQLHREAWALLSAIPPGHRTEAVCRALVEQDRQGTLMKAIRDTIRAELHGGNVPEASKPKKEAGDRDDAVLGFLRALQEGDDL